jgi:predicted PurR-regulated permease PerM
MSASYIPELSESARRWLRFFGVLLALGLLCWFAYSLRSIITPLLVALAVAYILNPVITYVTDVTRLSRLTVVICTFIILLAVVLFGGVYLSGKALEQIYYISENYNRHSEQIKEWVGGLIEPVLALADAADPDRVSVPEPTPPVAPAPAPATQATVATTPPLTTAPAEPEVVIATPSQWARALELAQTHGVPLIGPVLNYILGVLTNVFTWISLFVLIPLYTFFFLWHFNDMVRVVREHLPAAYRDAIVHVVATIDASIANFFRGRLMVCILVGLLSGVGWSLVGVGPGLLLGVVAGVLNLVPFMSILVLPPALVFAYLGAVDSQDPWVMPVALTMGVYVVVQGIESFLLSPAIEGRSSGLHPLVIVIAILVGGEWAGLLGMLLAIPVTSTLRTLAGEWVLPEIRRLAGYVEKPPEPSAVANAPPQATPSDQPTEAEANDAGTGNDQPKPSGRTD